VTEDQVFAEFMRRFDRSEKRRPPTSDDLDRMSVELDTAVPAAYRRFMTTYGGAYTPSLLTHTSNESEVESEAKGWVEVFDIRDIPSIAEVIEGTKAYWEAGMPSHLIRFATDCMGNAHCFERIPRDHPAPEDVPIVLFDHDYLVVRPMASSFVALLAGFLRFGERTELQPPA